MSVQVIPLRSTAPGDAAWLGAHGMPFTAGRRFERAPRRFAQGAGAHYTDFEDRRVLRR